MGYRVKFEKSENRNSAKKEKKSEKRVFSNLIIYSVPSKQYYITLVPGQILYLYMAIVFVMTVRCYTVVVAAERRNSFCFLKNLCIYILVILDVNNLSAGNSIFEL